ncbi:MAG TPA: Gfo/Idh/MocA family oxidoreductase [Pyrinomonadaceae bacterium]|nr:Gfo/Idh/MocA family oxidoreductase [Acidobacteriota bacterium]HQZ94969.1 Gfo/Idh/MocA family oxidoreductase [Pyrinomonadaceae bacterium]HRA41743.1 Gfo/Idh/MocA family oxidoreductase [Pyrinomonadaceae bacterium]
MSDKGSINRRDFVKASGVAAASALLTGSLSAATVTPLARKRYAMVGTGHRGTGMWGKDIFERYANEIEFVGLCDKNGKRAEAGKKLIGASCPTFTSFDEMVAKTKPELLMVTTMDSTHHQFITKALAMGIDVITEKPMVTEAVQAQAVIDAEKKNNRKITVAFNYRYAPKHQKIKEILQSGEIGKVTSVDFSWYLDTSHGADYFRRWHRLKAGGGSLWVHKATHHFDLVNWWLGADPVEVTAYGDLNVYGKAGTFRHTNCRTCPHKAKCPFFWDLTKDARLMKLYAECEDVDGYMRDGCVFKEDIDIYDTMSAAVKYSNGVSMSYSLNASMPIEGYRIAFNGTKGRLEVRDYERQPWPEQLQSEIYLIKSFPRGRERIEMPNIAGGHSGGDDRLREVIFKNAQVPEHLKLPDSRAGAMSCLTGIAARTSIEQKRPVKISELIRL